MKNIGATTIVGQCHGYVFNERNSMTLENLVKECSENKASWGLLQNDILFAVALSAMIECGFESLDENSKGKNKGKNDFHFK